MNSKRCKRVKWHEPQNLKISLCGKKKIVPSKNIAEKRVRKASVRQHSKTGKIKGFL